MVEKKRTSPPTKTENNTTLIFNDMVEAKRASDSSLKKVNNLKVVIFTLDRFYRENASGPGRKLEDLCQQKGLMLQPGYLPITRWGSLLLSYRSVCPFRQEEFGD